MATLDLRDSNIPTSLHAYYTEDDISIVHRDGPLGCWYFTDAKGRRVDLGAMESSELSSYWDTLPLT